MSVTIDTDLNTSTLCYEHRLILLFVIMLVLCWYEENSYTDCKVPLNCKKVTVQR